MHRLILSAVALGSMLVTAAPAFAQEDVSIQVSYQDLNLADPAGARLFHQRLKAAVEQLCDGIESSDVSRALAAQGCRSEATASAATSERQAIAEALQASRLAQASSVPPHP